MSRLDVFLTENGLAKSRERAKKLIKAGKVTVNGKVCSKPSYEVMPSDKVDMTADDFSYVGRGLLKLEGAFREFDINIKGLVCADIGASTGGFTQYMLENGAAYVYAVDVGHGQLDKGLAENPKVKNCEGVNARYLTKDFFDKSVSFMSVDLSFISLGIVMPSLVNSIEDNGRIIALIKPQFEAGKAALSKNGIVKDPKDHKRVLENLIGAFSSLGLNILGLTVSCIKGGDGNIEYLVYLEKSNKQSDFLNDFNINKFVEETFLTNKNSKG